MNPTATFTYQGNLRTLAVHSRSSKELITDAPVDNNGKGEAFSPTDLVATALVTCMITVMGIAAEKNDIQMGEIEGEVEKIMASNPRRVATLNVKLHFSAHHLSDSEKKYLENIAINCPVAKSIHPDIAVNMAFSYD